MILRSELFFSARNLHSQVSEPAAFAVGTVRSLELFDPPPSTLLLAEWTRRLGQELFFPPNVGGWPGGRDWLSGRTVVARANFAAALVEGRLRAGSSGDAPDLHALAARHGRGEEPSRSSPSCSPAGDSTRRRARPSLKNVESDRSLQPGHRPPALPPRGTDDMIARFSIDFQSTKHTKHTKFKS